MLFKITNDVVKLKAVEGFSDRYVIEEAFNFLYDYNIYKLILVIRGNELNLDKNYDAIAVYNQFREMQKIMVEEASKELPNFYDDVKYPYTIATPLCLETIEDVKLIDSIEEAVNFVEKFNVEKATFKHKNKLVNLNKKSDAYTILDKLKEPDSRDFDGGLGI
ncbi:MAG: hypothetical protein J5779_03380 [Clostridia bacterium]|nr:hypothetical protein [Clostridia bacterium]